MDITVGLLATTPVAGVLAQPIVAPAKTSRLPDARDTDVLGCLVVN